MLITIDYENQSAGFKKAIHKAESMQTPWFIMSYIFDYAAEEVAANIRLNDDLFDIAGERIPLTHHTHKDVWTLRVGEIVIPVSVY